MHTRSSRQEEGASQAGAMSPGRRGMQRRTSAEATMATVMLRGARELVLGRLIPARGGKARSHQEGGGCEAFQPMPRSDLDCQEIKAVLLKNYINPPSSGDFQCEIICKMFAAQFFNACFLLQKICH